MAEPTDLSDAGEVFRTSMKEALAQLDQAMEEARSAHQKAIDLQFEAKEEIKRIEKEAHLIAENYIDQHRKRYEEQLRQETIFAVTKKLILHGMKTQEIISLLDIPKKRMDDALAELGFLKLGNHPAHVAYENQGRAGNVVFYRDSVVLRFWYEFGGGNTLAFIDIPKAENWTAITGLPLEDRLPILNFIGECVIRDQAPGYRYEITKNSINIVP